MTAVKSAEEAGKWNTNLSFRPVPEQEELFRQVSQGLEKLTEMYSREKLPGLWKVTDRLNRAQEGKAPISSGRRNFRRVMALVDWLLGIFALIPAVQSPKELGTLLAVGRGGVRCGRRHALGTAPQDSGSAEPADLPAADYGQPGQPGPAGESAGAGRPAVAAGAGSAVL